MKRKDKKSKIQRTQKSFFARTRVRSGGRIAKRAKRVLAKGLSVVDPVVVDIRGLSKRDALFVTNILKGMSKTEAMKLAGEAIGMQLSDAAANLAANKSMDKQVVDTAIVSALAEVGINDKLVATKLKEGLDATAFTQTGIEHTDFKSRLAYIQTILKVKGQIGPDMTNQQQVLNYNSFKDEE